jgi:DNA-binding transcriptional regulator YhcF (GntR family)/AcrR family transcriptional regulator
LRTSTLATVDPPYARIVSEIRRRISSGELRPGERVPSTRQITQEWGVAIATATKVLATLGQESLVRAVPGVGTVVSVPTTPDPAEPRPAALPRASRRREPREAREGEQELTQERIVRTALGIADAEGIQALSMRRVATELGVATMTLYRYVPGKDDLVLLMIDAAFGEETLPEPPPEGWRAQLELSSRLHWAVARRHPWAARFVSLTRPQLLPNAMAHTEWVMRAMSRAGLEPATTLHIAVTLAGYVLGIAVNLESEVEAQHDSGITSEEWMQTQEEQFLALSARFPTIASFSELPDVQYDLDTLFEFGLKLTLDGIAVLLKESIHKGDSTW